MVALLLVRQQVVAVVEQVQLVVRRLVVTRAVMAEAVQFPLSLAHLLPMLAEVAVLALLQAVLAVRVAAETVGMALRQ
jgi:hypothetical protein